MSKTETLDKIYNDPANPGGFPLKENYFRMPDS